MYLVLFALLVFSTCHCLDNNEENQDPCGLLRQWIETSSMSVDLNKEGYHRELTTTVELSPDAFSNVRVLLVYRWPRGVYVDPFQLASMSAQRDWQILLDSAIDLELPAHQTSGFVTFVYPGLSKLTSGPLKVTIPVHGRYHMPSSDGEAFTFITIEAPELLLRTETCTRLSSLEPHAVVNAPCTVNNLTTCGWVQIQQNQMIGPISFQIPVGDGSLVVPVCGGTLLITLICCVALTKYMWKHRIVDA
ncbi:phosphatidylinositol-glycan biosynthesis class X protein isoform X1 [Gouania willdenowi]|uniref:Phosphatidylinositol-glycan biosynthesis class X protein n=1 Tax=Gouania willdenowi TaxID=441366 RepID=A0A8C5N874_GOUWI|nr:phosphatidylinositol-glycan biosynthesis class X protein isoform X1 [Gouania willdenowi]